MDEHSTNQNKRESLITSMSITSKKIENLESALVDGSLNEKLLLINGIVNLFNHVQCNSVYYSLLISCIVQSIGI